MVLSRHFLRVECGLPDLCITFEGAAAAQDLSAKVSDGSDDNDAGSSGATQDLLGSASSGRTAPQHIPRHDDKPELAGKSLKLRWLSSDDAPARPAGDVLRMSSNRRNLEQVPVSAAVDQPDHPEEMDASKILQTTYLPAASFSLGRGLSARLRGGFVETSSSAAELRPTRPKGSRLQRRARALLSRGRHRRPPSQSPSFPS